MPNFLMKSNVKLWPATLLVSALVSISAVAEPIRGIPDVIAKGARPAAMTEMSRLPVGDLEAMFLQLSSGSMPAGVYGIRVLHEAKLLPGSPSRKLSDVLWSSRVFELRTRVALNRTVTGDRIPAKFFCMTGPSDLRHESIIVDYSFGHTVPGYERRHDWIAGFDGLRIFEELRQVQHGLYLGKAWSARHFLHYFLMYSEQTVQMETAEVCEG